MKYLSLFFFLFSSYAVAQNERGVGNDIQQSIELSNEFDRRDEVLWSFKLKLSNLITSSPNGVFNKDEIKDYIKELREVEENLQKWGQEIIVEREKLKSLGVLLDQNKKIQREIIQLEKKDKEEVKKAKIIIKEIGEDETKVKKLIRKLNAHKKNISSFQDDRKRWEKYLFSVIKKDVGSSLYDWKINEFFFSPVAEIKSTLNELFDTIKREFSQFDNNYFKNQIGKLIFISIALALLAVGLLFLVDFFHDRYNGNLFGDSPVVNEIFKVFYRDRIILLLFSYLYSWLQIQFNIGKDPGVFTYISVLWPLMTYLWIRVSPIILKIVKLDNESEKINPVFFSLFFLFYLANAGMNYSSELLFLLSSILAIYLGRYVTKIVWKFVVEKKAEFSTAVKLSSYLVILLSSLIMVSSLIGILGFHRLGVGIQGVLFSNVLSFFGVIFIYQLLLSSVKTLELKGTVALGGFKFDSELFYYLKSLINTSTVFMFVHLVLVAWSENILVFNSIWDYSIFTFGEYNLTLIQPVKLIFTYYLFRGLYLFSVASIDAFWLDYFEISKRYSTNIKTIVRYGFILIFLSVALGVLGFTYKNIVIFASALGVGIGFGLQNIVNNFISGIILLFERPIRLGDMVEISGTFCKVTHIGIRSTIVESIDNSNIIIPNSEILSNKLINWTLNNNVVALNCSVGVAYGTDTSKVTAILKELLTEVDYVLNKPEAKVWFEEFADSSLNFKVKFWVKEPLKQFQIKSDIMHLIDQKLKQEGITIPFPQRDVHLFEKKS